MSYYQGDSFPFQITVQENGTNVSSLVGVTAKINLYPVGSTTALATLTQADCTASAPTLTGLFTAAQLASALGRYELEIEVTDAAGRVKTERKQIEIEADLI